MAKKKWTLEICKADAAPYGSRSEWHTSSNNAYQAAIRNGWMDECCQHMSRPRTGKISPAEYEQWLAEHKPNLRVVGTYVNAHTRIDHVCEHGHPWSVSPSSVKTGATCPSCKTKSIWLGNPVTPEKWDWYLAQDGRGFRALEPYAGSQTKILHECPKGHQWSVQPASIKNHGTGCPVCSAEKRGLRVKVTLEMCMASASKFKHIKEWRAAHPADFSRAHKQGWIDQCTAHMERLQKPHGYWTRERCIESALRFETITDWLRACPSYGIAHKRGWIDDCTAHMKRASGASDYDAVYVYEIGDDLGWTDLYKTGLTSWKNGDERIQISNRKNGTDYRIVALIRTTKGDARKIEQAILDSGEPFSDLPDTFVDGRTEVRRFGPRSMATINQLKAIAEGKPIATQKLTARQ